MAIYYRWEQSISLDKENATQVSSGTLTCDASGRIYMGSGNVGKSYDGYYHFASPVSFPEGVTSIESGSTYASSSSTKLAYYINVGGTLTRTGTTITFSANMLRKEVIAVDQGGLLGYVYNVNPSAYPVNGASGNYWYKNRITVISPTAPTSLAYASIVTSQMSISWVAATSNTDFPVGLYEVYIQKNGGNWYLAGSTANTNYTYSIPSDARTIAVKVRAKDNQNQYGEYVTGSTSQVLWSPGITVANTAIQQQDLQISWESVESADHYVLERKTNSDSDFSSIYNGSDNFYVDKVGEWLSIQYRVQSVSSTGQVSAWSLSNNITVSEAPIIDIQMRHKEQEGYYSILHPEVDSINVGLDAETIANYGLNEDAKLDAVLDYIYNRIGTISGSINNLQSREYFQIGSVLAYNTSSISIPVTGGTPQAIILLGIARGDKEDYSRFISIRGTNDLYYDEQGGTLKKSVVRYSTRSITIETNGVFYSVSNNTVYYIVFFDPN